MKTKNIALTKNSLIKKRNIEINEIIAFDKKIYTTLFFKEEINECLNQKRIIDTSNEFLKLKESCQEKKFYLSENIINTLVLTEENVRQINDLLLQKNSIEKGMTDTQASLTKILKQRTDFLVAYNNSVAESILPNKVCPLEQGIKELFQSDRYMQYLRTMSCFGFPS